MTTRPESTPDFEREPSQTSLTTAAARLLATKTRSAPQMQGISPRWLLRMLPWVPVAGGVYRVNRRLSYAVADGRVSFTSIGATVTVIPEELTELPLLHGFDDAETLRALAGRFVQRELSPGEVIVEAGAPIEHAYLIAHGKVGRRKPGAFDHDAALDPLADGDHFGAHALTEPDARWPWTAKALTRCTLLALPRAAFDALLASSSALQAQVARVTSGPRPPQDKHGQAAIAMSAGHSGEAALPGAFVDYELAPREYELSVAQTVLRVHTRVADLYNEPMNQTEQQLRLTIEALRERQEHEMVNNRDFGLLHNAAFEQRIPTRSGPPTPDDLDELLCRRRGSRFFLAHPRAIAAFGRECTRARIYPPGAEVNQSRVVAWRGVPILPCDKIPITREGTTSILVMRTGADEQGVVGLHPKAIPDEVEPGLSVRFMGIDEKAVISYLVSAYFSAAVLVPDALGILEDVEIGR